ncbi:YaaA family protein [Candidatus Peregrinibacteria bacterium]|nr:YaaA family protein [Candidatus Peregrinibacteria bacterium]
MIILLHSSKSMKANPSKTEKYQAPQLLEQAKKINSYLKTLSSTQIQKSMKVSASLAQKTEELLNEWNIDPQQQTPAIDAFRGDIYSGLQAHSLTPDQRLYANKTLYILSGLYGVLKALDGIYPYRLEMAYKFPQKPFSNMYEFWNDSIASCLPKNEPIINLAADEYSKTITKFVNKDRIISPKFLTINPKNGEPKFVVVHAKIARGAFANWLIKSEQNDPKKINTFNKIGYQYSKTLSTPDIPTFVCQEFQGTGLSVKLRP